MRAQRWALRLAISASLVMAQGGVAWGAEAPAAGKDAVAQAGAPVTESPKALQAPKPAGLAKPKMEIYGRLHMSVDGVSLENSPTSTQYLQFPSSTSLIGFRGSADFGPVKGLWQVENNVNVANGVSSAIGVGSRDTFVGLWTPYGTVKAGFFYAPYYYAVDKLDPLAWTIADFRSIVHNTGWGGKVEFSTRLTNSVQYLSPNLSGFEFALQYANPEQTAGVPGGKRVSAYANSNVVTDGVFQGDGDVLGGIYSTSLTYKGGPLYAAVAYEIHNNVDRTGDGLGIQSEQGLEVGIGYTLPTKTTITAIYEYMWRGGLQDGADRTRPIGIFASVKQDFADETLAATFGYAGHSKASDNDDGGFFGIAFFHHFAKSTEAYLAFAKSFNGSDASWGLGTQGHGTAINPAQPGTGPIALSAGLIHRFSYGL